MHTAITYQLLKNPPELKTPEPIEVKIETPTAGGTKIPDADFWTRINGRICFWGALVDNVYFYADSIDMALGLAPEILIFSGWGFGIGIGVGAVLAGFEAYSHTINSQINQSAKLTAPDNFPIPMKYKIPLGAHFVSDMTDWAGRLAMIGRLVAPGHSTLWNIGLKTVGAVIGAASSVSETRNVYKSFQKLAFWNSKKPQVDQAELAQLRV